MTLTAHGFEFLNLQAGLDFAPAPQVGIGPFVAFSLGQYSRTKGETSDPTLIVDDGEIENKALHQWLFLGVRGMFVL